MSAAQFTSVRWLSDPIPKSLWERLLDWLKSALIDLDETIDNYFEEREV